MRNVAELPEFKVLSSRRKTRQVKRGDGGRLKGERGEKCQQERGKMSR